MKKRREILSYLIPVLFLIVFAGIQEPPEPKDFVKNRTLTDYSNLFFNYEIVRYPSNVEIINPTPVNESVVLGVVVDPWNLNFGIVPTNGSYVKRNVEIANLKENSAKIDFKVYGNISPLVSFSKKNFVLQKNEKVTIDIYLFTNNTEIGNYSGEIDVIAQKPKYSFLVDR